MSFTALTDGRINVAIVNDDGTQTVLTTRPIRFEEPAHMKLDVGWTGASATVLIEEQLAASNEHEVTETHDILVRPRDFHEANSCAEGSEAARTTRRSAVEQQAPRHGQRLLTVEENIEALKKRTSILEDHLEMVGAGSVHHFDSLANDIRVLVCRGGRNFNPLLQRCAGHLDKMLPVFGYVQEDAPDIQEDFPEPVFHLVFNISPIANDALVEMDIDVWLDTRAANIHGRAYTHNDVLRAIADTEGSHHDPSVEPILDLIKSIETSSGQDIRGQWLIRIGKTVLHLAQQLV